MNLLALVVLAILAALVVAVAGLALFAAWYARRVEAQVPPIGRFAEVEGTRLHYLDEGSGTTAEGTRMRPLDESGKPLADFTRLRHLDEGNKPFADGTRAHDFEQGREPVIVMLHGLGGNLRNFRALIERLARTHRVIAIDRPDCGYSTTLSGHHPDLAAQGAIIAALLRHLGVQQPLVVGHSLGGALALALALDHPQAARALVLIAPVSQEIHEPPAVFKALDLRAPLLRRLIAWTLATPVGIREHAAMLRALFAPEPAPASFDLADGGALGARPQNFIIASDDMTATPAALAAMMPRYPDLGLPVDIVFGRQDPILDGALHGERLAAAIPGARLHRLDGGHMIPITRADEVAAIIRLAAARLTEREPARAAG